MPHFISFALNMPLDVIVLRFVGCSVSFVFIGCHSFPGHAWLRLWLQINYPRPRTDHAVLLFVPVLLDLGVTVTSHSHHPSSIYTRVDSACISLDLISQDFRYHILLCATCAETLSITLSPVFSSIALNQSLVPSLRSEVAVQLRVCVTLCSVLPVTSVVTSGLTPAAPAVIQCRMLCTGTHLSSRQSGKINVGPLLFQSRCVYVQHQWCNWMSIRLGTLGHGQVSGTLGQRVWWRILINRHLCGGFWNGCGSWLTTGRQYHMKFWCRWLDNSWDKPWQYNQCWYS